MVNSTGDAADNNPGNGACDTGGTNSQGATECTLRAAIEEANALAGANTIEFNIPTGEIGYQNLGAGLSYWRILPASPLPRPSRASTVIVISGVCVAMNVTP